MKSCIILNAHAGSAAEAEAVLRPYTVEIFETNGPEEAIRLARQAADRGYRRIAAAGGDGTLNEVLNGIMSSEQASRIELGLIPLGTANDFARSLGVPLDVHEAVRGFLEGEAKPIDIVRLTTSCDPQPRYLVNVSAGGFSGLVSDNLDKSTKDFWGALAYGWTALQTLPELVTYHARIRFDDEPVVEVALYNVVAANAGYVGGSVPVAPLSRVDDGLLDVLLFKSTTAVRLATLIPKTLLGQHLDDPDVIFRQVRRFEILHSEPAFALNADGEVVGECPAVFQVLPSALSFVFPTQPGGER